MTNKYNSGRVTEYKIKKFLIEHGYSVQRSAGSKGTFDIIAYNDKIHRHIQAKRENKKSSYKKDIKQIEESFSPPLTSKELWVWRAKIGWVEILFYHDEELNLEVPKKGGL